MRLLVTVPLAAVAILCWAGAMAAQDEKYTLRSAESKPPAQLKEALSGILEPVALQVLDGKGEVYCEVWLRKVLPAKATDVQVQNGLTYREFEQTTLLGAVRFVQKGKDYRSQEVPAGVYTLRLAYQPQDGDHMGTAPHTEFCLLVAADKDEKPALMQPKGLYDLSAKSLSGNHPGVLLLFPNAKPAAKPELVDQGMGHWVLRQGLKVEVNGKPATIGLGLTLVGHSPAG